MIVIIILPILSWISLGVIFYLIWHFNKDPELKLHYLIIEYLTISIAFTALIISLNNLYHSRKIQKDKIVPKLQVKPIDIQERINITQMKIDILNYSEYVARNIFVDIKFGDHSWKRELTKAEYKDTNRLIVFDTDDKKLKNILENFYNRPIWNELKPGRAIKLYMADEKKEFLLKQKTYLSYPDGTMTPISPTETSSYRRSQGWSEDLKKTCSGQPIRILIRAIWENEIGKKFDRIVEYKLVCTKIGTGRSYTFIPSGIIIEDI